MQVEPGVRESALQELRPSGGKVVESGDVVPEGQKPVRNMAAGESGNARDEGSRDPGSPNSESSSWRERPEGRASPPTGQPDRVDPASHGSEERGRKFADDAAQAHRASQDLVKQLGVD